MQCPKCNKTYDDDFKFCPYCGEETPELKYCYECLYKSREFIFCPECGTTLLPKEETIKTILNIIDGPFLVHITGDPTAETLVHVEQCVEQAKNYKKLINLDPKAEYVYNYLVYLNKIYEVDPFTLINGEEFNPKKLIQNKEEILDIINKTLETYPRNGDYLFLKGRYLEIVGECEEAITYYENARHSIMENYFEELSRDYIKLLEKLGKYGGLLKLYDNLIVDSRTSTDTRRQYISNKEDLLEEFKRYDELFEFYNFIIEMDEYLYEQRNVLIRKGHLLERFKRYDEALELYLKFDLFYDAIDLLVKLEKYDTALKLSHSERFHYKEIRILKKLEIWSICLEILQYLA